MDTLWTMPVIFVLRHDVGVDIPSVVHALLFERADVCAKVSCNWIA